ncbi:MAG: hypothetical protein GXN92_03560 [Candidatus Micrarchaeota archaeon]|nr:hypothetical protein [Candidatus Micrarchaeota archaeon]
MGLDKDLLARAKRAWELFEKSKNPDLVEKDLLWPLMVFAYFRKPSLYPRLLDRYAKEEWKHIDKEKFIEERIPLKDYLNYLYDFPLYYRDVRKGWVRIDRDKDGLEVLKKQITQKIASIPREEINKRFKDWRTQAEVRLLKVSSHPPCIEALLKKAKEGKNMGHYERLALALYLVNIRLPEDDIVEIFKSLPNFKEKTTRYHIQYVKEKGYSMFSCDKMKELKLCVAECGIKHPMEWHYGKKAQKTL